MSKASPAASWPSGMAPSSERPYIDFLTRSPSHGKGNLPIPGPLAIRPSAIGETLTKVACLYGPGAREIRTGSDIPVSAVWRPFAVSSTLPPSLCAQIHLEREDTSFPSLTDGRDSFQSRSRLSTWESILHFQPLRPIQRIVHFTCRRGPSESWPSSMVSFSFFLPCQHAPPLRHPSHALVVC